MVPCRTIEEREWGLRDPNGQLLKYSSLEVGKRIEHNCTNKAREEKEGSQRKSFFPF